MYFTKTIFLVCLIPEGFFFALSCLFYIAAHDGQPIKMDIARTVEPKLIRINLIDG